MDHLVANRLPKTIGRVNLCHALNTRGGVHSEFTIMREAADSFYLVSAGALQRLDHDWLQCHMPADGSVRFDNLTNAIGVLVVAGPKARELLQRVSDSRPFQRSVPLADRPGDRGGLGADQGAYGSISSASSAGSCITRSSTRTTSSMR